MLDGRVFFIEFVGGGSIFVYLFLNEILDFFLLSRVGVVRGRDEQVGDSNGSFVEWRWIGGFFVFGFGLSCGGMGQVVG